MFDAPDVKPKNIASLYRLDKDLSCHRVVEGVVCSNGLAWSPDSRQMYYTDSYGSVVWQWDFDALTGCVDNRRVFIDLTAEKEFVDGATVDSDGCYWATIPYKGKVQQYDPTGKLMRVITLPADLPTCCEFGGPNLEILYVTTATLGRKATLLAGQSQPGGLFAVETGSTGLTLPPFAG
jgi:sugar lactone lactonase YvrE